MKRARRQNPSMQSGIPIHVLPIERTRNPALPAPGRWLRQSSGDTGPGHRRHPRHPGHPRIDRHPFECPQLRLLQAGRRRFARLRAHGDPGPRGAQGIRKHACCSMPATRSRARPWPTGRRADSRWPAIRNWPCTRPWTGSATTAARSATTSSTTACRSCCRSPDSRSRAAAARSVDARARTFRWCWPT